jgi:LuxR family maltose regulon positive regulatory protein
LRVLLTSALRVPADPRPAHLVPPQGSLIDFVHLLLGQLPSGQAPLILAIDDAHVLTDPQITDLLDMLVRCGHPRLHVVLAARRDPPLPLHRYRLAGHLHELRTAELAMTPGEVQEMLAAHRVTLPVSALNGLAARTEGWAAGVRLAAMRMEHAPSPARLVRELSFDHGSAGEYFMAEVLDRQPEPLRRVLIETSFLDEVTRPLAEAVTGLDGAGEMLAEFARDSSFVITLDPAATRFRYHRLFAEVLRYLLTRDRKHEMPELATRAAACFETAGDLERALYWAAKAGDRHRAATVLVRGGLSRAFARRHAIPGTELTGVLPSAPGDRGTVTSDPEIALAVTVLRAASADAGAAARELERVRGATTATHRADEAVQETGALVELMLGLRSGDSRAVDGAAIRLTRKQPSADLRGAVLLAQASAHFWHGAHEDVAELLSQALTAARQAGSAGLAAEVLGMIACVDSYSGRPRHADDAALQAHRLLRAQAGLRTPLSLRLAAVIRSVQKADLAVAARHLRHAKAPVAISADPGLPAACTLWRATVLAHSGRPHDAQAILETTVSARPPLPLLEVYHDVILGGIEARLGRPEAALRRLEPHRDGRFAALADVACAQMYLALDDTDSARESIRRVLTSAGNQSGRDVLVEAMLLGARIAEREHDTSRALDMITNALDMAQAELVLPFVQAREAFAGLLARHPGVVSRWPAPPADVQGSDAAQGHAARHRPVSLTQREQSVLAYLATSMTAAEIAAELYLSVSTVKTHLAAIYRKLSAGGRREAVRRARELELLLASRGADLRVFADQVHDGVDERQVRECLRKVPQVPPGPCIDLLGIQQQRAGIRQQLLAQPPRPVDLPDLGQRRDKPERADRERPFLTAEAVVGFLHPVPKDQVVLGELVRDRQHGRPNSLVVGRQETCQRDEQQRGVQGRRLIVLAEHASAVNTVGADIGVDLVCRAPPPRGAVGVAAQPGQLGTPVRGDPAEELGGREVPGRAANFPYPLVGIAPVLERGFDLALEHRPATLVEPVPAPLVQVEGIYEDTPYVVLALIPGRVTDADWPRPVIAAQVRQDMLG